MQIVCYGDSNTYGYDPRDIFGGRLSKYERWTGRLATAHPGWALRNEGLNGREIPHTQSTIAQIEALLQSFAPDIFIIMLGTNDLLNSCHCSAKDIISKVTARMDNLLAHLVALPVVTDKCTAVLLVAPPPLALAGDKTEEMLNEASRGLGPAYAVLAEKYGVNFADAGAWDIPLAFDGVHFSVDGHRIFASHLDKVLQSL